MILPRRTEAFNDRDHRDQGSESDDEGGGGDPHEPAITRRYDQPTHPVLRSVEMNDRRGRGRGQGKKRRGRSGRGGGHRGRGQGYEQQLPSQTWRKQKPKVHEKF